eukprot:Phypoly_transcript_12633.p1 GENE.Phypoly_transcript_12633~~Phypoly_transcript_12633.p1  ORF type:complete len:343 (+),score=20.75 Phypoly_transcript_12633:55-1083(+)
MPRKKKPRIATGDKQMVLFQDLAIEIRIHVYGFADVQDWKMLRHVCSLFKDEIDSGDFKLWKDYAWKSWRIPSRTLPSNFEIMGRIDQFRRGITKWQGYGTQEGWFPYPMCLEFTKANGTTLEGTCDWETLRGTTKVTGELRDNSFSFCESEVLRGYIAVPNQYRGARYGNCALFVWHVLDEKGCAYGVMKDVEVADESGYLNLNELWEGVIVNPKGAAVAVQLSVLQVLNGKRKVSISEIESPQMTGGVFTPSPSPCLRRIEIEVDLGLNTLTYSNSGAGYGYGVNWLDWGKVQMETYTDMMVGWVTYSQPKEEDDGSLAPTGPVPYPRNRDNIIYLKKIR